MFLTGKLLLPKPFKSKDEGRKLLELFAHHLPRHAPARCGDSEPLRSRFDPKDLESALRLWGHHGFLAERGHPNMLLDVLFSVPSRSPRHSSIALLRFESTQPEDVRGFCNFVWEASDMFGADYAAAHVLTRSQLNEELSRLDTIPDANPALMRRRVDREGFEKVLWGMTILQHTSLRLGKYLPDLLWLTVFGRPYVDLFGREKLLATPAFKVQELSNNSIGLTVAEGIEDSEAGWQKFKDVRDRCKKHLDSNAFFDPQSPRDHVYRSPEFRFPPEMYKSPLQ